MKRQVEGIEADHFFNLLTSPDLLEVVEAHLPAHRERRYPPTQTLAMFLAQPLRADGSCRRAVNEEVVGRVLGGLSVRSLNTGGYCQARRRLPVGLVQALVSASAMRLEQEIPAGWCWRGRSVKLVDGTTVSLPDTVANQARYPQHGKQRRGTGFPLMRLVAVVSLATGAVLETAMGPFKGKGSGEHALLRRLLACFEPGDVVVADAYYCSYFLLAELCRRGVDAVFARHDGRQRRLDFHTGQRLGVRDHVARWTKPIHKPWWMSREAYLSYPDEIAVREVQAGGKVLVTTLLDPRQAPKRALGELYGSRWHVELDLRNIKATLGMDVLRCQSPDMCEKEVWIYLLAYNLIRLLMAQTARRVGVLPRELSFKHAVQIWVAWSQRQFLSRVGEDTETLYLLLAQVRVGLRPGRREPRAVKRRPDTSYPRLDQPRWKARQDLKPYARVA